jgi:hypothetical protein
MAKNTIQYYTQAGRTISFNGASGTYPAGANGTKILAVKVLSVSGATDLFVLINGNEIFQANPPVVGNDVLSNMPQKAGGSKYANMETGQSLTFSAIGGTVNLMVYGEDY